MSEATPKVFTNEDGSITLTLPVSKQEVTLRSPKGRDIKALEAASAATDATQTGVMFQLISQLSVKPKLTTEEVEDLDAEDVFSLGEALSTFRAFSRTKTK